MVAALLLTCPARPDVVLGSVTRRRFLGGTVGGAVMLGLAGCGDDENSSPASETRSGPSRVVALGQGADADTLLALGIVPVGMSAGYNQDVYPWTAQALRDRPVQIIKTADEIPIEQVAALEPDLIVATTYYGLERFQGSLEQIATVVGPSTTADEETWQETTTRVGEAVGQADRARQLVADVDGKLAAVRDTHPDWKGRTFTFGPVIPGQQLYTVSGTDDPSAALLTQLGLELAPAVTALPESNMPGRATVSLENMGVLDADVLMLVHFGGDGPRTEFESSPVFQQIPAVVRGAYLAVEPDVALGLAFPSVLTIPYSVDRITPALENALRTT